MADQTAPILVSSRLRRFVLWTLAGVAIGIVAMLVAMRAFHRDPTPTLTPERFNEEHEAWNQVAPVNYDIEIRVSGSQPATYRVAVRDGQAQSARRNGQPLLSKRTFGTWSVPGMFSTISRDIEAIERHAAGKADRFTPRLILRASFDAKYHYPTRYVRIEQWSTVEVTWDVTEFRVVEPDQ